MPQNKPACKTREESFRSCRNNGEGAPPTTTSACDCAVAGHRAARACAHALPLPLAGPGSSQERAARERTRAATVDGACRR